MDALRRAETAGGEAPREPEQATLSEAIERPASNTPLQLEPLDPRQPAASTGDTADRDTPEPQQEMQAPTTEAPEPPEATPQQAQSALEALKLRRSSMRRRLVFAGSGLFSAAAILTAYYFWQIEAAGQYYVAPAATLIDASDAEIQTQPAFEETPEQTPSADDKPAVAAAPPPAAIISRPEESTEEDRAQTTREDSVETARAAPDYRIEIQRTSRPSRVPGNLTQAYQAYRQGNYAQAEQQYREVLKTYPENRDAMLGLAAIAVHQGNRQLARYYYTRILKSDPSDKNALLALQGLGGGEYSLENGSRLKYWLQEDAGNPQLHFALGNQYAAAGQWKEAQQSYFEAHRLAPANADYAFNLAVSLDQLGLGKQALEYYRQARALASGGAMFSSAKLDERIRKLQASAENAQ